MNKKIKEDRRVRKTKKALREGLVELLNEKNIQDITIKELTDKVDIHRSTFYSNFKDIYDLYSHMEDSIIQEIEGIISVDCTFKPHIFFNGLLGYINKNKQISRLFFGGNISTVFFERLTGLFKNACIDAWCKEYSVTSVTEEIDYYVQFCLSGGLGVIGMWVAKDFEYPMEILVEMLSEIDSGVGKVFGNKFSQK
ncbi:MAG: TetR/AcrR family transcriptional regulator [Lachnospiraceae bacterium]|nr:TetR/AcrR family transcriptional regulator [Lachnospiraceae bacterium]